MICFDVSHISRQEKTPPLHEIQLVNFHGEPQEPSGLS